MVRWMFLLMVAATGVVQAANSGVLIGEITSSGSPAEVIAAVRQAFVGRKWTIESVGTDSITAILDHNRVRAKMRIWLDGDKLMYEETSVRQGSPSRAPNAAFLEASVPHSLGAWLENLRHDVRSNLAGIPARLPTAADRLKALEELRTRELISEDEYAAKRAEILRAL